MLCSMITTPQPIRLRTFNDYKVIARIQASGTRQEEKGPYGKRAGDADTPLDAIGQRRHGDICHRVRSSHSMMALARSRASHAMPPGDSTDFNILQTVRPKQPTA